MGHHFHLTYLHIVDFAQHLEYNQYLKTVSLAQWLEHWSCTRATPGMDFQPGHRNIVNYA